MSNVPRQNVRIEIRFARHVNKTNYCWQWTGPTDGRYGTIGFRGNRSAKAHRVSYVINIGEIPDGCHVCHKCDNTLCVNPDHLFIGNHTTNMRDMMSKGRGNKPFGIKCGASKLSDNEVIEIRNKYQTGLYSQRKLSKTFKVSQSTIWNVVNNRQWRHIT